MVIYNAKAKVDFLRYGIQIPSLDSRKTNTLQALLDDPFLGSCAENWLIRDFPLFESRKDLERAHTPVYLDRLWGAEQEKVLMEAYELVDGLGNYNRYKPEEASAPLGGILEDVMHIVSGTYAAVLEALDKGFCYFLGGGMHHAHPAFTHGFCLLNDICIALLKAEHEGRLRKVWIVDMDAHRGDGTAEIMASHKEMTTLSIHMASGWPLDGPQFTEGVMNPGWFPGDVDIPVASGEEALYTIKLLDALEELSCEGLPDLAFVVAGVDPFEKDELPSSDPLNLTKEQMLERDQKVYRFLEGRNIPSAWVAAGGYGRASWEIHTQFLLWVLKHRLGQTSGF